MSRDTASALVAKVGETRKLRQVERIEDAAGEMRRANLAIVTYNNLAANSIGLVLKALEKGMSPGGHVGSCIAVGGNQGCVPNCLDAKQVLATVADAAKKALEEVPHG